jgi:hypothetical protein
MTPERELRELIAKWRKDATVDRKKNAEMNARLQAGETVMIDTIFGPYKDLREGCADELEKLLAVAPAPTDEPEYVECPACSEAGGADRSVKHKPPICKAPAPTPATPCSHALDGLTCGPECAPAEPAVPHPFDCQCVECKVSDPEAMPDTIVPCDHKRKAFYLDAEGNEFCVCGAKKSSPREQPVVPEREPAHAPCCIFCGRYQEAAAPRAAGGERPETIGGTMSQLQKEIATSINRVSAENGSNTPDFILAEFLTDCLAAWDKASLARERWYGKSLSIGGVAAAEPQVEGGGKT